VNYLHGEAADYARLKRIATPPFMIVDRRIENRMPADVEGRK